MGRAGAEARTADSSVSDAEANGNAEADSETITDEETVVGRWFTPDKPPADSSTDVCSHSPGGAQQSDAITEPHHRDDGIPNRHSYKDPQDAVTDSHHPGDGDRYRKGPNGHERGRANT